MYIDLIIKEEVNIVCGEAIVGLSLMFTSVFAGCYCSGRSSSCEEEVAVQLLQYLR